MTHRLNSNSDLSMAPETGCTPGFVPCVPEQARAVALGFRHWMLGLTTADIDAWQCAWEMYASQFGVDGARQTVGCLSKWVGAVSETSCRDVEVFPEDCSSFCRDECLAVSLIAACQHKDHRAAQLAAQALLASPAVDEVLSAAHEFADALSRMKLRIGRSSLLVATDSDHVVDVVMQ